MIPKTIGLHVAKVANLLDKRQGMAVAMGFLVGCMTWFLSWLLDLPKFSISAVRAGSIASKMSGCMEYSTPSTPT
jgi:hypothetical protein